MRCPCRKKSETATYDECCRPYHGGLELPATAEVLMRSRYTAFALQNAEYLRATWHASTRPVRLDFTPGEEWIQLRVLASSAADASPGSDRHATVEFIARSRLDGANRNLHEVSNFVCEAGKWYYVDGLIREPG